jgi:hypothetical protein
MIRTGTVPRGTSLYHGVQLMPGFAGYASIIVYTIFGLPGLSDLHLGHGHLLYGSLPYVRLLVKN